MMLFTQNSRECRRICSDPEGIRGGQREGRPGDPGEVLGEGVLSVTWASVMVFTGIYECQNLSHFILSICAVPQ